MTADRQLIRLNAPGGVLEQTGMGGSTVYRDVASGVFPQPVAIGKLIRAWLSHEIQQLIALEVAASRLSESDFDRWKGSYISEQTETHEAPGDWFHTRAASIRARTKPAA